MKFLKALILFFTPYTNFFEWKVDRFFKSVKSDDSIFTVQKRLLDLMRENLIVVNIWMERKYKGYKYLKKSVRKRMYINSSLIVKKFYAQSIEVSELGKIVSRDEKLKFLTSIMAFLKPGKHYHYIKTASFGKLLRDPSKELLEGDCNQIVTLYIYLYSTKFPIEDLQIKLLPEHVCLHFNGVDIEATNGTFQHYKNYTHILPVTEIISTNLLDLADFREKVQEISPRVFLKSSQLAYSISSLREIVESNLKIAYKNLSISSMKSGNFSSALFFAEKLNDFDFLKSVKRSYAVSLYDKGDFEHSLKVFQELNDENGIKASLSGAYNLLANKVKNVKTQKDFQQNKHNYRKMLEIARKLNDQNLIENLNRILK